MVYPVDLSFVPHLGKMMEEVEDYFLVVMEVFLRSLEEGLRSSFGSSKRRKMVIDEGDQWFKYLDENENMEKHGS
ncbi:hypothetical protein Tco_1205800, partial [Tanacetum coccineum]